MIACVYLTSLGSDFSNAKFGSQINVRYWHKADMGWCTAHVCFLTRSRTSAGPLLNVLV